VTLPVLPSGPVTWRFTVTPVSVGVTLRERSTVEPDGSVVVLS
jgi:hypothetical protein